jgi:hypothetical protein
MILFKERTGCVLRPGKAMPNNMYLSTLPTIRYAVEFYSVIHNLSDKHVNMFRWKLKLPAVFYLVKDITAHPEFISKFCVHNCFHCAADFRE